MNENGRSKPQAGGIPLIDWKRYALESCGYECITTFGNDFDIADAFGLDAIQDTYNRAFRDWKEDYKYLTELVLILNWKIWQHYGKRDDYAGLYDKLWSEANSYALDNLTGEEAAYFWNVTD